MRGSGLFIVNPNAGRRSLTFWRWFEAELRRRGIQVDQVLTARAGDAFETARERAGTTDAIVAVGGDGTVLEVVSGIMASGVARRPLLGIVPAGTGNDTAAAVGIRKAGDALLALSGGAARLVDLIEVQCHADGRSLTRHAMLFASVGITGDLLRCVTPRLKRWCGRRFAYLAGLLFVLPRYSPVRMRVARDLEPAQGPLLLACASNGATFGGGIRIAPQAQVDDGQMDVNLVAAAGRWEVLRQLGNLCRGRHINHPKVTYRQASQLTVEAEPPAEVAADGDLIGWTPARFLVCRHALQVMVPPGS